jgi:hypothetical protein
MKTLPHSKFTQVAAGISFWEKFKQWTQKRSEASATRYRGYMTPMGGYYPVGWLK